MVGGSIPPVGTKRLRRPEQSGRFSFTQLFQEPPAACNPVGESFRQVAIVSRSQHNCHKMNTPDEHSAIERSTRQRVLASYRHAFPRSPSEIVIGFSGGVDSLALALMLLRLGPLIESSVRLLHVDHRMQPGSRENADAARALAAGLGLPIEVIVSGEHPRATYPGIGDEDAGRRVRFLALHDACGPGGVVALAHHAEDQSETVLLHLLRGSGTDGLAGMQELDLMPVPWWEPEIEPEEIAVWRPLLGERKADLAAIVASSGLFPVVDLTNDDLSYRRNEIRHLLMPVLREIEPTIDIRLGTLAKIAAGERVWMDEQAERVLEMSTRGNGLLKLVVRESAPALSRRIVRRWCRDVTGLDLTFDRVEAIRGLVDNPNAAARIEIGENLVAWCDRDLVRIEPADAPPI